MNGIPESIFEMTAFDYDRFLTEKWRLMSKKIKKYNN